MTHSDHHLYVYHYMNRRDDGQKVSSHLLSHLLSVESSMVLKNDLAGFCENLHGALSTDPLFSKIDRICLVKRVFSSRELTVVDAFQSNRLKPVPMIPGYRCYVRNNTSLLKLKEGVIRAYDDPEMILKSYHDNQEVVQRSLKLLVDSGIKCGLTLPIHYDGTLTGFLFLNSSEEGVFSSMIESHPSIIGVLQLLAKSALLSVYEDPVFPRVLSAHEFAQFETRFFDAKDFRLHLLNVSQNLFGQAWLPHVLDDISSPFLYSPSVWASVLIETLKYFFASPSYFPGQIRLQSKEKGWLEISMEMPELVHSSHEEYLNLARISLEQILKQTSTLILISPAKIRLLMPIEEVEKMTKEIYSTEIKKDYPQVALIKEM